MLYKPLFIWSLDDPVERKSENIKNDQYESKETQQHIHKHFSIDSEKLFLIMGFISKYHGRKNMDVLTKAE